MLKLRLLEQFSAAVCRKGRLVTALALILASTSIPRAHAQLNIGVSANPACPGATVNVSVINQYNNTEGWGGDLEVTGCIITDTDGQTYANGYFTMPGLPNVVIVAAYDNGDSFTEISLTVTNSANVPASTNVTPVPGTIISTGVLSPTNFVICAFGSGIANPPGDAGTVVSGMWRTNIISLCSNTISSNGIVVPYTQGDTFFTWMSNGILVTNLPAAFTNGGSYTFEAYVNFIPPADFAAILDLLSEDSDAVTVDLGPLTVCVFSFTNTCTPGSVSVANTSATTNYILGASPNLSVSNIAINAALEFITNCPCDASLNADVTSNLPPIILSNWWTVTGPGTNYTNSGSGLSTGSLPPPTNGGTGTATFYVSYTTWTNSANSAPWCCTNTNSVQIPFNVLQLTLTNLAFTNGNHTVYQDANAQPYPSPQWTTNTSWPVCYTSSNPMTVMPVFSVTPSAFPLPVLVQGISSGPLLPLTTNSISGPNLALTIISTNNFHTNVDFLSPMTIDWKYSIDNGSNWCDAGTNTNQVFVTLGPPLVLTNLFRTVLYLACANTNATNSNAAASNTWSFFKGPDNVTAWDTTNKLYYYEPGIPWASKVVTLAGLLASRNGQCMSWCKLLEAAWQANGIASTTYSAKSPNQIILVNNWTINTPTVTNNGSYNFLLLLTPYTYTWGTNRWTSWTTASTPPGGSGDMNNVTGVPGQNTATPAEKIFSQHFIQLLNGSYYDPSYGVTYTNASDFQAKAIAGFGIPTLVTNGTYQMNVKLPATNVEITITTNF